MKFVFVYAGRKQCRGLRYPIVRATSEIVGSIFAKK
jgi:hypothetical protein